MVEGAVVAAGLYYRQLEKERQEAILKPLRCFRLMGYDWDFERSEWTEEDAAIYAPGHMFRKMGFGSVVSAQFVRAPYMMDDITNRNVIERIISDAEWGNREVEITYAWPDGTETVANYWHFTVDGAGFRCTEHVTDPELLAKQREVMQRRYLATPEGQRKARKQAKEAARQEKARNKEIARQERAEARRQGRRRFSRIG